MYCTIDQPLDDNNLVDMEVEVDVVSSDKAKNIKVIFVGEKGVGKVCRPCFK